MLGGWRGRARILKRLGPEANDALDEFLNLALDYERTEAPSLQGFVASLRQGEAEVKRDMEMDRDEVRVMTVHGAKGLEAPIVILADTTTPAAGWHPPKLLRLPPERAVPGAAEQLVWAGSKDENVGPVIDARAAIEAAAGDEYRRLLYVAMTRAAERLIVCGTEGKNRLDGTWYSLVGDALRDACVSEPADDGAGDVLRYRKGEPEAQRAAASETPPPAPIVVPDWLTRDAPQEAPAARTITPSSTEADAVRRAPAPASAQALLRGSLTHRLMQSLPDIPEERRRAAAEDYLARAGTELPPDERSTIVEQVLRLVAHADFRALYAPGSRAEVPIVGRLMLAAGEVRVSGQVDRLVVTADEVLIADFKTNRPAPQRIEEVPKPYIRQLALYRALLAKLYPDRRIRAALVWTEVPDLMEISAAHLDAALAQVKPA